MVYVSVIGCVAEKGGGRKGVVAEQGFWKFAHWVR